MPAALFALPSLPPLPQSHDRGQMLLRPVAAFVTLSFVPPRRAKMLCRRPPAVRDRRSSVLVPPAVTAPLAPRLPLNLRPRSLGLHPLNRKELAEKSRINADRSLLRALADRPRDRSECKDGYRPCPYVSCRHHLAIDHTPEGAAKPNFPGREVWELKESCSLDVADKGPHDLPTTGKLLNVTYEGIRLIETNGLKKFAVAAVEGGWGEPITRERMLRMRKDATRRRRETEGQRGAERDLGALLDMLRSRLAKVNDS